MSSNSFRKSPATTATNMLETKAQIASSLFIAALFVTTTAQPAHAYRILDEEELRVDLSAWAQAGYVVREAAILEHEPYIGMARMAASARYPGYGGARIQIDASSGVVRLLDVVADLTWDDVVTIRAGRFKVPTSRDFLIPAPATPFATRSQLVDLAPKRLVGAELVGKIDADPLIVRTQFGWFQPDAATRELLPDARGNFISARAAVDLPSGLGFHLAYFALVLADNAPVPVDDDPAAPLVQPVEHPQGVDAAVTFSSGNTTVFLEGLIVPDPLPTESEVPWGAYLHALHMFEVSSVIGLEPGARYGLVSDGSELTHKAIGGLTMYVLETKLSALTNYELTIGPEDVGHAGYVQIQAGL